MNDNKKFWKTVKPLFSDKLIHKEVINLTEDENLLDSDN